MYGESCPVFCPSHYRPVCGASKLKSYVYRTFNNGCYLDMINCRGEDDYTGYVEVPLEYCPHHLMKNIFKEQVVITNMNDFHEGF
ncbi:vasotab-TY1 [Ostrinia nubilalis]